METNKRKTHTIGKEKREQKEYVSMHDKTIKFARNVRSSAGDPMLEALLNIGESLSIIADELHELNTKK